MSNQSKPVSNYQISITFCEIGHFKDKRGKTPLDYADGRKTICRLFEKKVVA